MIVKSIAGCSTTVSDFETFFNKYIHFVAFILIPISIFMMFYGIRFIKTIIFTIGFVFGFSSATILSLAIVEPHNLVKSGTVIGIVLVAIIVGILIGWGLSKLTKFYLLVAGGFLGYALSFEVLRLITMATNKFPSNGVQLSVSIAMVLVFAIVGYFIHDHVLILSTSFGGSFLFVFAVSSFLKNYPDLGSIAKTAEVNPADAKKFKVLAGIYIFVTLFLTIIAATFQYRQRKRKIEENKIENSEDMNQMYPEYQFYTWNMNDKAYYKNASSGYI